MTGANHPPVVGAICRPQVSPEEMLRAAVEADRAGLAELWLWEDCFLEGGLTSAAAILGSTEQVVVGIGLLPMPLRNVAITAMEISTLARMFPGRLRVAVGHGVQPWMEQVGARARSPLGLAREYLTALRALLSGETVTVTGDYVRLDGVSLGWPPQSPVPVLLGAIGPKSLALAGECADGVLLDADFGVAAAREAVDTCRAARAAAGVDAPFQVALYQRFYRGPGAEASLQRDLRPGGSDVGIVDEVDAVVRRVRELGASGVETVVLMPSGDEADPAGYLRVAAQQVAPRVSS